MLSYWNDIFDKSQTDMSKSLAPLLVSAFKTKFNSDIIRWKQYCKTIESSAYLSGESFHLSLYWALKFEIIDRIRAGEFGVKEVPAPVSMDTLINQEEIEIETGIESEECKDIRRCLLKKYGVHTYKSWFKSLKLKVEGKTVRFKAKNKFTEDWILKNYPELII